VLAGYGVQPAGAAAVGAWVLMLLALGLALATVLRSVAELAAVQDVGGLVLTGLGGALVPLSLLAGWVRHVAPVSPGYWGVRGITAALTADSAGVWRSVAVLFTVAAAGFVISVRRVRSGWSRKDLA